jgi:hypothetical protein
MFARGSFSFAEDFQLQLDEQSTTTIPTFQWDPHLDLQAIPLQIRESDTNRAYFVRLQGKYTEKSGNALLLKENFTLADSFLLHVDVEGNVDLQIEIQRSQTPFTLFTVDFLGNVLQQEQVLSFPLWKELTQKFNLTWGLLLSSDLYSQIDNNSGVSTQFQQLGWNFDVVGQYKLNESASLGGEASMTILPISLGGSGNTIRYLVAAAKLTSYFQALLFQIPFQLG